jgi:hypothetical protein
MIVSLMEFRAVKLQTLQNRRGDLDWIEVINFPSGTSVADHPAWLVQPVTQNEGAEIGEKKRKPN